MTEKQRQEHRGGLWYGFAAYGLWGVFPIYFRAIQRASPYEILAHRIVWSVLLLVLLITILRAWPELFQCLRSLRSVAALLTTSLLIAFNWFLFIYGVSTSRLVETSLGYFINPLFSVALGMVFFRERLRPGQWAALALAAAGMLYLVVGAGQVPWIALGLAVSFGFYGLLRKSVPVDALIGLFVETAVLAPLAAAFLAYWWIIGTGAMGQFGWELDCLLLLSGPVTALPLLCFGRAARRLPLSTLGFLQYLAPSIQFLLAVGLFGEAFRPEQQLSFGCIWAALAIYSVESIVFQRLNARERHRGADMLGQTRVCDRRESTITSDLS